MFSTRVWTLSLVLLLVATAMEPGAKAFSFTVSSSKGFGALQSAGRKSTRSGFQPKRMISMDLEGPTNSRLVQQWKLSSSPFWRRQQQQQGDTKKKTEANNNNAVVPDEFLHGMPWKTSIDPQYTLGEPYYMPFWEYQMQFMKRHLTNLRALPVVSLETGQDLSYREISNNRTKMRMHTLQFTSDEFRLIRLTLMDAGTKTQVFTSVWYPNPDHGYNTPILGIDCLLFGLRKHLCIMDFQPIHDNMGTAKKETRGTSAAAASVAMPKVENYQDHLDSIRDRFPSLHGNMTHRFYDENQFFSPQLLLGRSSAASSSNAATNDQDKTFLNSEGHNMAYNTFFPAFEQYLQTYLELHQRHKQHHCEERQQRMRVMTPQQSLDHDAAVSLEIWKRHAAYDAYSSQRDPAHGLLANYLGHDFADDYVYNILFPYSRTDKNKTSRSSTS